MPLCGKAQPFCTLACNTSVNVSLPAACEAEILYDMILEGTYNSNTCQPNGPSAFTVVVMQPNGVPLPTSPFVDSTHIGQNFLVKVKHWATGNSCWGGITVEDKLPPALTCPPDVTVACTRSTDPAATGEATATDCSDFIITHNDEVLNLGCNNSANAGLVKRTWKAQDEHNNSTSCVQTINIDQPAASDVQWPIHLDDNYSPSLDCENPDTDPSNTGWPTIGGQPIPNGSGFCNMAVTYDDLILDLCEKSFKILRTWTVVAWCNGSILTHTQVIAVKDKKAPVLSCPPPLTAGTTSSIQCQATVILPAISISDNCSTTFTTNMNTPNGWVGGNGGVIHNVNTGTYTITYQVTDDCKNTSTCSTELSVVDDDSPTVVCDEFTVTTLNNGGISLVFATSFDDGTYDNCGFFDLSVRRMQAACGEQPVFGPSVLFCCEDVGQDIQVEMKATDSAGNANSCMVTVHVDDNSEPAILCPPNVAISCQQDPTDLSLTGEPQTVLACGSANLSYSDFSNVNQCDVGTIERIWTATASNGNSSACTQLITLEDNTPVSITFPDDYEVAGCVSVDDLLPENLPPGFDFPTIVSDCEMMATNVSDQVFTIAAPACFKIVRTWTVINKCTYQAGSSTGIWSDTQIIKVTDTIPPTFTCPANVQVEVDSTCTATVVLPQITDIQDCSSDISVFISSDLGAGAGPFFNVGTGSYSATYTVADGCTNTTSCTIGIEVVDLKKPTPYCKPGLIIELMGVDTDGDGMVDNGMATTWAEDLNDASFDNCPGALKFSFSSDINDTGRDFDCGHLGQNSVEMWVTDAAGNQDFCLTSIIIQDNMGVCSGNPLSSVGGAITNEEGEDVENVTVSINDGVTPPAVTGPDGNFVFPALPLGNDFTVSPEKDINLLNGVTTYDIVLIRKHILGVQALGSPYKLIAADVNKSGSVTTYDMVILQKNILHVDEEFPNNRSWRFVDKDYIFPDETNPFEEDFPEVYNINNFQGNMNEVDFIAVKVGDVNGSAVPNMLAGGAQDRGRELLTFKAAVGSLLEGQEYRLEITSDNFDHIIGFQFTLDFDPAVLEYIRVEKGELPSLTETNFGFALLDRGAVTSSWNHTEPVSRDPAAVLFSLVFRAKTNTTQAPVFQLGSTYTPAEAYHANGEVLDLELLFDARTGELPEQASRPPSVVVAAPNPFHQTTVIGFELSMPGHVSLTVFDNTGRVVETIGEWLEAGHQSLVFQAGPELPPGTYFYQLKTKDGSSTDKLILVK
ncbi:MAG TPA: HYR domain-containing protein [Bacteroidetes bacterium]|nr:HYR domain-containing protein [Bacteroidota bacterium]